MNLILQSVLLFVFIFNGYAKQIEPNSAQALRQQSFVVKLKDSIPSCITIQLGEGKDRQKLPHEFPNKNDAGENQYSAYTPASYYYHLLSIPFHQSERLLRVYSSRNNPDSEILRLVVYNIKTKSSFFIADIKKVSATGNSEGLFCPFAITKDDKNILLNVYMGDAGAGGGSIDYGYSMIPVKHVSDTNFIIQKFKTIATRSAFFYDLYSKVLFVDEGNNTPHYDQPGPSNNAVVLFYDLIKKDTSKKLLAEKDKSYEILGIDEQHKVLKLKVTSYTFSTDCPRNEGGLLCAKKSFTKQQIELP